VASPVDTVSISVFSEQESEKDDETTRQYLTGQAEEETKDPSRMTKIEHLNRMNRSIRFIRISRLLANKYYDVGRSTGYSTN
jgi:hypothetical protein